MVIETLLPFIDDDNDDSAAVAVPGGDVTIVKFI